MEIALKRGSMAMGRNFWKCEKSKLIFARSTHLC